MSTDIILYHSVTELKLSEGSIDFWSVNVEGVKSVEESLPEILFLTSFPPRECGIATYSQDLMNAIEAQFENTFKCVVCALESDVEQHVYQQQPKYILNIHHRNAFAKMAFHINNDENIKLVVIQHKFGFFSEKEADFNLFIENLFKPIFVVFHTVLPKPNKYLLEKIQNIASVTSSIVVMTNDAANILKNEYHVTDAKITVIPHGTHLVPPIEKEEVKKSFNLEGRKVLSTFGLLNTNKSIETTLEALPEIIKHHPEVMFLILGKTHPAALKQSGEVYREKLVQKVLSLGLTQHVQFVNEYLQLPILLQYLQLTDIYLFTSKDPNQAVSGTFSYAVSCGCPVISTPIPHAKEVLSHNNGIIIDFEDDKQLSKAVVLLLDDENLRAEISSNSLHQMAATAWQNSAIAHALLFKASTANTFKLHYRIPPINLNHVKKMTSDFGMVQFSKIAIPDIDSGYTLDDNARALIAICQHYELFQNKSDFKLIHIYLKFIKYCLQPNAKFLNYVNEQGVFTPQNFSENLDDSNGRAIWALGYVASLKDILPTNFVNEATQILQKALPNLVNIHSTRAMAFIIKGLSYYGRKEDNYIIQICANRMAQMYKHEKNNKWFWFENYLTYGNSLLPEAMLCAYKSINKQEYKDIAKESFDFLLSKIFKNNQIKVIPNNGWFIKDKMTQTLIGGEQPIDVAYTIIALEKFYTTFGETAYKTKAKIAFNWFLGENHLHQVIYNPATGGCYDGLEAHNVNLNQGAESTLSYLMGRLAMERIRRQNCSDLVSVKKQSSITTPSLTLVC